MSLNTDKKENPGPPKTLRALSLVAGVVGALGSLYLMGAGHHNDSALLWSLFTVWIVSPWIALLFAFRYEGRWPMLVRKSLYIFMLALVPLSLLGYTGVFSPPGVKPAFVFLVVPLLSWVLIVVVYGIALVISRSNDRSR